MHPRRRWLLIALSACVALAALWLFGCGGSDDGDDTPTSTPLTSTAAPSALPGDGPVIRSVDFETIEDVQKLVADSGASVVNSNIVYADLTGDGVEEAVVPLSSGGTAGDVAFIVLTPDSGGARTLLQEHPQDTLGLTVEVIDDKLVMTEAVRAPDDAECCPSMLRKTTYGWNGAALALESVQTVPGAGIKGTPAATP
jgi:hypothetical protein